jgi:hypothetical protein
MEQDQKVYTYLVDSSQFFDMVNLIASWKMGFASGKSKIDTIKRIFANDQLTNEIAKDLWDLKILWNVKEKEYTVDRMDDFYRFHHEEKNKIVEKWYNILWKPFDGVSPEGYSALPFSRGDNRECSD